MFQPNLSTSAYAHDPMEGVLDFAAPSYRCTVAAPTKIVLQDSRRNPSAVRLLPVWAAPSSSVVPSWPLPLPSSSPARTVSLEWAMSRTSAVPAPTSSSSSSLPRTRQTRISDHLKAVKTSSSSSPRPKQQLAAFAPASSDSVMASTRASAASKSIAAKTRRSARSTRSTPEVESIQCAASAVVEQLPGRAPAAWSDERASPQRPRLQSHQALHEQHTSTDAHPHFLASTSTTKISTRSSGRHVL
ncbi:BZ3500_MvSof-1268-A1-R1_Chr1-1g01086 [Microbotryum saponariae]|uniref:BZ3500_MvSof-1268-A1-R1_Chr1-1g01086 protein n=1 Tax=Microbotryum saponariae TaxID=289078 RepID=A0A2X0L189_9BASI|nr:BZ3500_MvSof-1268-A1-R1_Chr1-1g01086 [Microbotryum saponariae]SCZ93371.1 BZ3501_MvSof-1269-A2-R1_Chr1-1g00683 [Microbotryum saponariae]